MTETPTTAAAATTPKKPQGRSPSYPGIDLDAAIGRARDLYGRERQHPTSVETVLNHWGYSPKSGPGSVTLAAVKKYGLISEEGSGTERQVRITDLAVDILANPDEAARAVAIATAALTPPIHREMWERYKETGLPSDANLKWDLTRQRGFTESGATEFIGNLRKTISQAGLDKAGSVSPTPTEEGADSEDRKEHKPDDLADGGRKERKARKLSDTATSQTIPFQLPDSDEVIFVELPGRIPEADWDYFMALLGAMKRAHILRPEDRLES